MMVDCKPKLHNSRQAAAVALCCENGNTSSDSIKGWAFLSYLNIHFLYISATISYISQHSFLRYISNHIPIILATTSLLPQQGRLSYL
jgi:hypothetical protein